MCQTSAIPRPTLSSLKSHKTNTLYLRGDTTSAIGIQMVTLSPPFGQASYDFFGISIATLGAEGKRLYLPSDRFSQ